MAVRRDRRQSGHIRNAAQRIPARGKTVVTAINGGGPVACATRRYGVSRQWAYGLKRRRDAQGDAGLPPRPRAVYRVAGKTDTAVPARIVGSHKRLQTDGPDAGAESSAAGPEREGVRPPANSTIHRILIGRGRGLSRPLQTAQGLSHSVRAQRIMAMGLRTFSWR